MTASTISATVAELKTKPLISIIIPAYNYAQYIEEALKSVLKQSYDKIELIVVDDGSTDNLKQIIEQYPETRYYRQKRQGPAKARNLGAKNSKGDFLIFLDADDRLHPRYVELTLKDITKDARLGLIYTGTQCFGRLSEIRNPRVQHHRFSIIGSPGGQIGAALIRREAFDSVNGYDERLLACEDGDLVIRLWLKGWKIASINLPIHYHRIHDRNLSGPASCVYEEYLKIFERKFWFIRPYRFLDNLFSHLEKSLRYPRSYFFKRLKNRIFSRIYDVVPSNIQSE